MEIDPLTPAHTHPQSRTLTSATAPRKAFQPLLTRLAGYLLIHQDHRSQHLAVCLKPGHPFNSVAIDREDLTAGRADAAGGNRAGGKADMGEMAPTQVGNG